MTPSLDMHAMIDIEALGTNDNAPILWIAGVKFNMAEVLPPLETVPDRMNSMYDQCYLMRPSLASNLAMGRKIDHRTLRWWLDMDRPDPYHPRTALFKMLIAPTDLSLQQSLASLRSWLSPVKYVWSNGINFDLKILALAYHDIDQGQPWRYKNERDTRTLWHITGRHQPERKIPHHPLWDAWTQAQAVQYSWSKVNGPFNTIDE